MSQVPPVNLHGTAIVISGHGVLIRGASGAGKSLLALQLIADHGATLVADDRVDLVRTGQHIAMTAPPALAGLIELRGLGIVTRSAAAPAPLSLVVALVDPLERMPEEAAFRTAIMGLERPRCPVPNRDIVDSFHQILLVLEAVKRLPRLQGDEFA